MKRARTHLCIVFLYIFARARFQNFEVKFAKHTDRGVMRRHSRENSNQSRFPSSSHVTLCFFFFLKRTAQQQTTTTTTTTHSFLSLFPFEEEASEEEEEEQEEEENGVHATARSPVARHRRHGL